MGQLIEASQENPLEGRNSLNCTRFSEQGYPCDLFRGATENDALKSNAISNNPSGYALEPTSTMF